MNTSEQSYDLATVRILIADDNVAYRIELNDYFRNEGYDTYSVGSVQDVLTAFFNKKHYDAVLLDVCLPSREEGLRCLATIREGHPLVPVIIHSELTDYDTVRKAFQLGAADYLQKPADYQVMRDVIDAFIANRQARVSTGTLKAAPVSPRILVIDDDADLLDMLRELLRRQQYFVHGVTSMETAINALLSNTFELVISDVKLGDGDGLQLLYFIRDTFPTLPVIFVTGHATIDCAKKAFQLGISDFIEKPYHEEQLLEAVDSALKGGRSRTQIMPCVVHGNMLLPSAEPLLIDTVAAFIHKLNNEFVILTRMAHKMGNAIQGITGEQVAGLKECQAELLDILNSSKYHLQRFRNVMGRHPGKLRPTDLKLVLLDVEKHLSNRFPGRLSMSLSPEPCEIIGDYELLWHLIENLIRNGLEAVQGRDGGKVSVAMAIDISHQQIHISVQDNGEGIAPDKLSRIFELNYSTKPKGMGIGLFLARRAAQIHGGQIECKSNIDEGTIFTVTLPIPTTT